MIGPEREAYMRQLHAEEEMRRAINSEMKNGAQFTDEQTEALIRQAKEYALLSIQVEEAAEAAHAWIDAGINAASDFADVIADMLSGTEREYKGFWESLTPSAQ